MFLQYFVFFFLFKHVFCTDPYGVNVGTVLFTSSDNSRRCWSNEELALLRARLVFQDLLPRCSSLGMEDDKFVTALVNYFRLSVERVKSMTAGKVKEINMKAVTDAIGGYLHHIVIPEGKRSFYSGKISYDSARQLTELYDEMKLYLRTDGSSWAPPIKPTRRNKREIIAIENIPNGREKRDMHDPCGDLEYSKAGESNGGMTIPMPFLDSKTKPTAIAVPFKAYPLRNIKSKSSAFVLVKYYQYSIACMKQHKASEATIIKFNHDFNAFLDTNIIPHINDEALYPAFGSVYQLKDALTGKDATVRGQKDEKGQSVAGAAGKPGEPGVTGAAGAAGASLVRADEFTANATSTDEGTADEDKSTTIMFSAVAVVILIWIITGIIYCCCRMRRRKQESLRRSGLLKKKSGSSKAASTKAVSSPADQIEYVTSHCPTDPKERKDPCCHDAIRTKPTSSDHHKEKGKAKKEEKKRKTAGKCPNKCNKGNASIKCSPRSISEKSSKDKCPKCKPTIICGHSTLTVCTANIKGVKSAPISLEKSENFGVEKVQISSSSNTSAEKPVVFGYDFETSSTDSSSIGASSSSSGSNTPKR